MKLAIALPLTTDREYSQFWDSFHIMRHPDHVYLRPQYRGPIDRVRNELIKQAFESKCSHILLMDTDQIYRDPETIYKLIAHANKPVVGTVVHRGYPPYDPLVFRFGQEGLVKVPEEEIYSGKLIEVDAIGCGCVLYNLAVFEQLPPPWFEDKSHVKSGSGKSGPGEDINICYKLRGMGVNIWVETSIAIDHLALLAVNRGFYTLFKKLMKLKTKEAKGE